MTRYLRRLPLMALLVTAVAAVGCSPAPRQAPAVVRGLSRVADPTFSDSNGAGQTASPDSSGWGNAALPKPDLGYNAREGRTLYRHYCLNCHGDEGAGDGFNAYNLDPHPRALTDSTFQAKHSDDDLANVIRSGGSSVGLSNGMPPWGRTLNERKVRNIVDYLRSFRASVDGSR